MNASATPQYEWKQPSTSESHLLYVRMTDGRVVGECWRDGNVVVAEWWISEDVVGPLYRYYDTPSAQKAVEDAVGAP